MRYERFGRWESPTEIEVALDRDASADGEVELRLLGGLATDWDVEDIRPPPDGTELVEGGVAYRFPIDRRVGVHQWIFP